MFRHLVQVRRLSRISFQLFGGVLVAGLLAGSIVQSRAQEQNGIIMRGYSQILADGTMKASAVISFKPQSYYDVIKANYPDLYVLFRDVISNGHAEWEVNRNTVHITSNDATQTLSLNMSVLGAAYCKEKQWRVDLSKGETLVTQAGRKVITSLVAVNSAGVMVNDTNTYILPPGATQIHVDTDQRVLAYDMPTPHDTGNPEIGLSLLYHKDIMSSAYKVYADPSIDNGQYWVAKAIVHNTGHAPMYNVKVWYSLGQYADHASPDTFSYVMPGGAVVSCYYPLISDQVATFKTENPAHLNITVSYEDAHGHTHSEQHTRLVTLLSINQFVFTNLTADQVQMTNIVSNWMDMNDNAPLAAAYVTKTDDPVKQFAGYVSDLAGGVAAADSDKDALTWLQAAYNLELVNNIVYQTPSGFLDGTHFMQDVKFPRDTLRAKSGTCIDLAILYTSLVESVGMDGYLMLVPGHCFSVIKLPGGEMVGVENTGLGGGNQRQGFAWALKFGTQELQKHLRDGRYYLINIDKAQGQFHITPPSLPPVDANFLTECGIQRAHYEADQPTVGGGGGGGANPAPAPNFAGNAPGAMAESYAGTWNGVVDGKRLTIKFSQHSHYLDGTVSVVTATGEIAQGDFRNVRIGQGDHVSITCRVHMNGHAYSLDMEGSRNSGTISGDITIIQRGIFDVPLSTRKFTWRMAYSGQ